MSCCKTCRVCGTVIESNTVDGAWRALSSHFEAAHPLEHKKILQWIDATTQTTRVLDSQ